MNNKLTFSNLKDKVGNIIEKKKIFYENEIIKKKKYFRSKIKKKY